MNGGGNTVVLLMLAMASRCLIRLALRELCRIGLKFPFAPSAAKQNIMPVMDRSVRCLDFDRHAADGICERYYGRTRRFSGHASLRHFNEALGYRFPSL